MAREPDTPADGAPPVPRPRGPLGRLRPRRLGVRLILSLTLIVALVAGVSSWLDLRNQERLLLDQMQRSSEQLSDAIVNATWHAMLEDRRDAAYAIMKSVARHEGIHKVRIFNKEGRIVFSTGRDGGGMVDKRAEACDLCHAAETPKVTVDVASRTRVYPREDGDERLMGLITPVYNEPSCSGAPCHAHPEEIRVLGVLDVSTSLAPLDRERDRLRWLALRRALVEIGLLGLMIFVLTRRLVADPIRRLIRAIRGLRARELDRPIRVDAPCELGELEATFEDLRQRLSQAMDELEALTRDLERKVEERTEQLQSARERLAKAERLASLGQLAATVAHEINNPVAGILNLARVLQRIVTDGGIPPERVPEARAHLEQVAAETTRVGRIVSDLLTFARPSKPLRTPTDLDALVETTAGLLSFRFQARGISVHQVRGGGGPVPCDAQQVQQVLTNLLVNAAEASPEGAVIEVQTLRQPDRGLAVVEVRDRGTGIPPEVMDHVFEPFFTTKHSRKGLGLGLAVAWGIVRAHGGGIEVSSTPGQGATFRVTLPLVPPEDGRE